MLATHFWVLSAPGVLIRMADTCMIDSNTDFMRPGRGHFDLFKLEVLSCAPTDGSLAGNWFSSSWRHRGCVELSEDYY